MAEDRWNRERADERLRPLEDAELVDLDAGFGAGATDDDVDDDGEVTAYGGSSSGYEGGSLKGMMTPPSMGKAHFQSWSSNVKAEGKAVSITGMPTHAMKDSSGGDPTSSSNDSRDDGDSGQQDDTGNDDTGSTDTGSTGSTGSSPSSQSLDSDPLGPGAPLEADLGSLDGPLGFDEADAGFGTGADDGPGDDDGAPHDADDVTAYGDSSGGDHYSLKGMLPSNMGKIYFPRIGGTNIHFESGKALPLNMLDVGMKERSGADPAGSPNDGGDDADADTGGGSEDTGSSGSGSTGSGDGGSGADGGSGGSTGSSSTQSLDGDTLGPDPLGPDPAGPDPIGIDVDLTLTADPLEPAIHTDEYGRFDDAADDGFGEPDLDADVGEDLDLDLG